jgi:hypothetical protein
VAPSEAARSIPEDRTKSSHFKKPQVQCRSIAIVAIVISIVADNAQHIANASRIRAYGGTTPKCPAVVLGGASRTTMVRRAIRRGPCSVRSHGRAAARRWRILWRRLIALLPYLVHRQLLLDSADTKLRGAWNNCRDPARRCWRSPATCSTARMVIPSTLTVTCRAHSKRAGARSRPTAFSSCTRRWKRR